MKESKGLVLRNAPFFPMRMGGCDRGGNERKRNEVKIFEDKKKIKLLKMGREEELAEGFKEDQGRSQKCIIKKHYAVV